MSSSKIKNGRRTVSVLMRGQFLIRIESPSSVFWGFQYFLTEKRPVQYIGHQVTNRQPSNLLWRPLIFNTGALGVNHFKHSQRACLGQPPTSSFVAAGARGVYPPCLSSVCDRRRCTCRGKNPYAVYEVHGHSSVACFLELLCHRVVVHLIDIDNNPWTNNCLRHLMKL